MTARSTDRTMKPKRTRVRPVAAALIALVAAASAWANPLVDGGKPGMTGLPAEVRNVDLARDRIGALIPLDAEFTDSTGERVKLGDLFRPGRPVVLSMVYYECPMMCTLALNGTQKVLAQMKWTPGGDEFNVVTVSFNPKEGPDLAAPKKATYIEALARPGAAQGWSFLTGDEPNIARLTEALGFKYELMPNGIDYAHASALYVLTPDGRISQVLSGIQYDPESLRLSLVEASGGKLGTIGDLILMFCAQYNPHTGRHQLVAAQVMKLGGAMFIIAMSVVLLLLWRWDRYRRNLRPNPTPDAQPRTA